MRLKINSAIANTYKPELTLPPRNFLEDSNFCYPLITNIYLIFLITAQVLAFRMISFTFLDEPGGIFVFPLTFAIVDIVTEIYGLSRARKMIINGTICQIIFTLLVTIVIHLPTSNKNISIDGYLQILGGTWMVLISNICANVVSELLNSKLLAKLRSKMSGHYFTLRCIISSWVSEIVCTFIIVLMVFFPSLSLSMSLHLFIAMLVFKIGYSMILGIPANIMRIIIISIETAKFKKESVNVF
jgi:uncharacterized integral membrane protein (TIGR00697 family)